MTERLWDDKWGGDAAPVTEATGDLLLEGKSKGRPSASRPQLTKESESADLWGLLYFWGVSNTCPSEGLSELEEERESRHWEVGVSEIQFYTESVPSGEDTEWQWEEGVVPVVWRGR